MVNRMKQAGVFFDQTPSDDFDRARLADAALVIAVHVGTHGQFRFFFGGGEQFADIFLVLQRVAGAAGGSRDGAGFDAIPFHAHKHFGRRAHQLFIAELNQKLIGAGVGALHPLKQFGGFARIRRLESLSENDLVIVAAPHAFTNRFHVGHVFGLSMIRGNGAGLAARGRGDTLTAALQATGADFAEIEFIAEALDLLALAIHVADVVAEEEMKVFAGFARQPQRDGFELKKQVVTESTGEGEFVVEFAAEFARECAEHRKNRGLFTPLFLRKQRGHGFEPTVEEAILLAEIVPVRMVAQYRGKHVIDGGSALIQWAEGDIALETDQFEGRAHGDDIPTRIPARVLVAGRQIDAPVLIELAEKIAESLFVGQAGGDSRDANAMRRFVTDFPHDFGV